MLQDIPTATLREASSCVLETERLMLRRPTLADVKAIAHLANDRRIAENTRRLPHPYSQDHAIEFVRAIANDKRETVFLIENNFTPIGVVGIDWRQDDSEFANHIRIDECRGADAIGISSFLNAQAVSCRIDGACADAGEGCSRGVGAALDSGHGLHQVEHIVAHEWKIADFTLRQHLPDRG